MDITRNVGIREPVCAQGSSKITDTDINSLAMKLNDSKLNRNSLPNILLKEAATTTTQRIANGNSSIASTTARLAKANVRVEANAVPHVKSHDGDAVAAVAAAGVDDDEVECAVSGRLEIRVIQKNQEPPKSSPVRDESIYFDAVANGQQNAADDAKVSRKLVNKMYGASVAAAHTANDYNVDTLATGALATMAVTPTTTTMLTADCGNFEQATDETAFYSVQTTGRMLDDAQKSTDVTRLNLSGSNPNSDGDNVRMAGNNGTGLVATTLGITDNNSSMNDDNAVDSFITAGNVLAKSSNVIGKSKMNFTNIIYRLAQIIFV